MTLHKVAMDEYRAKESHHHLGTEYAQAHH